MPDLPKLTLVETHGRRNCVASISNIGKILPTRRPPIILRSLLIEIGDRIVLVDPGIGVFDWLAPNRASDSISRPHVWRRHTRADGRLRMMRPLLERHGLSPDRVTDIVLTHAHHEVLGAISDFPAARIHLHPSEAEVGLFATPQPKAVLAHGPSYRPPLQPATPWQSFLRHRLNIDGLAMDLVDLPGHTRSHAGVLLSGVKCEVFYLGAAVSSVEQLTSPSSSAALADWQQSLRDEAPFEAMITRERLRRLVRRPPTTLTFVFAHGTTPQFSVGPRPYPSIGYL